MQRKCEERKLQKNEMYECDCKIFYFLYSEMAKESDGTSIYRKMKCLNFTAECFIYFISEMAKESGSTSNYRKMKCLNTNA